MRLGVFMLYLLVLTLGWDISPTKGEWQGGGGGGEPKEGKV